MRNKLTSNNISVQDLLGLYPDELLDKLSDSTNVDHQVKKLFGKNIFYLLLYGFLESTKVSLRGLEDIYNSHKFKFLFNIDQENKLKYNSLSDRLTMMNPEYFKRIYEHSYHMFSEMFSDSEAEKHSIIRVDSTLVKEAANRLQSGMTLGNQYCKGRYVKYTVAMDDLFPCGADIFTSKEGTNENITMPQVIINQKDKSGIFVFDRGINSRDVFDDFDKKDISFVTRINPTKQIKLEVDRELKPQEVNNLLIYADQIGQLYNKQKKLSRPFRIIKTKKIDDTQEELWFLTNSRELSPKEIASIYKKRWDIEVFFRFIKQELNFSHFVSTSENGIKNILYITLILSMLILIYKKVNNVGYKTAVRRFRIELDEMINKLMIICAGGDPDLVFR